MRLACIAVMLTAVPLFGQTHNPFPADFTPSPCAPANSCQDAFPRSAMPSAAFKAFGLKLDAEWIEAHADEVIATMTLACRRHATCLGTAGNDFTFCDDVLYTEVHLVCDQLYPNNSRDREECTAFRDTHLSGIEATSNALWKEAMPCTNKTATAHTKPLEVWTDPARLPAGFNGDLRFYALDPDTHVPMLARVTIEGQNVVAVANPAGILATYYLFKYKLEYTRVPNSDGHTDVVPPMVTISAPAYPYISSSPPYPVEPSYPETKFRLPADVPRLVVEMSPKPERLHKGKNRVTISTRDAASGKPVEMRVIVGTDQIGNTNGPLTIELEKSGRHPEIWLTSLYNRYSDVVVARER